MDKKTYSTTKEFLLGTGIPEETRSYKPVTHAQLIDTTLESIERAGFVVDKEYYSQARKGRVANGRYTIRNVADDEMQMQVGWQNSLDKSLSLKWALGVQIFICSNGAISGDMGAFKRKHVGEVQTFTPRAITEYIKTAGEVFLQMQKAREQMKGVEIDRKITAELVGRMFIEHQFINSTQLNIIKREISHPSFDYGAPESLWQLYNHTTLALRDCHPEEWMSCHAEAHQFFVEAAGIIQSPAKLIRVDDPLQMTIFQDSSYREEAKV